MDPKLEESDQSYRIYLIVYFIVAVILFYCILCFSFRHTYQLPVSSPGVLVSDRWTYSFIREWLFWVYWLVFLAGPVMRQARSRTGVGLYLLLLFALFAWFCVNLGTDIIQMKRANVPPTDPNFDPANLATDQRYCCVYGGQPGTALACYINTTIAACPPISASQLNLDGVYLLRFITNILLGAFIVYDFWVTWLTYLPVLNEYLNKKQKL